MEFLKPWRRRIGCVLLIVAAVSTSLWCLSLRCTLSGRIVPSKSYSLLACAWDSYLVLGHAQDDFSGVSVIGGEIETNVDNTPFAEAFENSDGVWAWQPNLGFVRNEVAAVIVSLWLIAIPATALSAILLLWPSRRAKSQSVNSTASNS